MSRENKIIIAAFSVLGMAVLALSILLSLSGGFSPAKIRQQKRDKIRIDSLERSLKRWEVYSENLLRIVNGETPVPIDSIISRFEVSKTDEIAENVEPSPADSTLRAFVREEEKFNVSDHSERNLEVEAMHFINPVKGTIAVPYNSPLHPYLSIIAGKGSSVKAILEGNVVYTGWSESEGWCIIVQHESGILSIYKHNETLLKQVADHVSAGSSIAILGSVSDDATGEIPVGGPNLHFELWINGEPVNPATYLSY